METRGRRAVTRVAEQTRVTVRPPVHALFHRRLSVVFFFFQAEDGIRDLTVTGVQTCALPISFLRELLQRLSSAPGIQLAAATDRLPLSGEGNWGGINIVGRPLLDAAHAP